MGATRRRDLSSVVIVIVTMALALTLLLIPTARFVARAGVTAQNFAGGSGTVEAPYLVATAEHLDAVRHNLGAHFRQVADIDLGIAPWSDGAGWVPIGTTVTAFTGVYDGDGYVVRRLTIVRAEANQGLFGVTQGAHIKGLALENVSVYGQNNAGGLVGWAQSGTLLERLSVSGEVTGTGSYVGGLVARLHSGSLVQGASTATVVGATYTGGLVGESHYGSIGQSYAVGSATGTDYVGGLVGRNNVSILADSYSHATVSGSNYVGGLAGWVGGSGSWSFPGEIYRSYSTGAVIGTGTDVGGFLGVQGNYATVADSYWDVESSGQPTSAGGVGVVGRTTEQMQQRAPFAQWNFYTLWQMDEGHAYPAFQPIHSYGGPQPIDLAELEGTGTVEDPYLLHDADELHAMRLAPTAHYRLADDIDLSATVAWDGGRGWTPIGPSSAPFKGSLDGAGFSIRNLHVSRPTQNEVGLFAYTQGAHIHDLTLENVSVYGQNNVGSLVGWPQTDTLLERVSVSGQVTGLGSRTGGLAGYLQSSILVQGASTATVVGKSYTGGLVGDAEYGNITQSYALGTITGTSYVGGLVGRIYRSLLADSYSYAAVSGNNDVGGLAGILGGSSWTFPGQIYRSYSSGSVQGTGSNVGGLLGTHSNYGIVGASYWDVESSDQTTSAGGAGVVGETTEQMQRRSTYAQWNFYTLWQMDEGHAYPAFQPIHSYGGPQPVDLAEMEGSGTAGDPYLLHDANELHAMRLAPNAHYRLANDIDLSATVVWDGGRGWTPIGPSSAPFKGSLDGAGFTIRNLYISRPAQSEIGLFAYTQGAHIHDLILENVSVYGQNNAGGLIGWAQSGTLLERLSVSGEVTGTGSYVGGQVARLHSSSLVQGASTATVVGASYTGGLVGESEYGTIAQSYALGTVTGTDYVGGLLGRNYRSLLEDSYSHAAVSGSNYVGGLVGHLGGSSWSSAGELYRSYSSGSVQGTESSVGGFLGVQGGYSTVADNYWDTESSGQATSAGGTGVVGKTTAQMRQQETFVNWDFVDIWAIQEGVTYPWHQATERALALAPALQTHRNDAAVPREIAIVSNLAWTAVTVDDWITLEGAVSGRGNGVITYTLGANPVPELRVGTISVGDGTAVTRTVTVHQSAQLGIAPPALQHPAPPSSGHTVAVSGNVSWTATADDAWITVTHGADGSDAGSVTYRVDGNAALTPRSGTITMRGGGIERVFQVSQAGALPYLYVTALDMEHGPKASTGHSIDVSSNVDWTTDSDANWITITSDVTGTGDGSVVYSLETNLSNIARTGTIQISGGRRNYTVHVQQAGSIIISVSASPEIGGTVLGGGAFELGEQVTVTATALLGYTFAHWTEDDLEVSTDASYTFVATENRDLVGLFTLNDQTTVGVFPPEGGTLTSDDNLVHYTVPAGAFTDTVRLVHLSQPGPTSLPAGQIDIGRAFTATMVLNNSGIPVQPQVPITVTIEYADTPYEEAWPGSLALWRDTGSGWTPLLSDDDPVQQRLVAQIDHFSEFAVFGQAVYHRYLPFALR